ncbi:MAG: hypothetical protein HC836_30290 [Richelia sp. RM2_1_2]|nr:hypothetical protein [Richelia sp. RM2_1_2]
MFDIIFLSYDESDAEKSWRRFNKRFFWAKRVHGICGIYPAHVQAAKISNTKMFWVVDADSEIVDSFKFDFVPENSLGFENLHVFYAKNPATDDSYGYGGLKLFPRKRFLNTTGAGIDMATSVFNGLIVIEKVASITHFNTTPFSAWRSAFRECVKLSRNLIGNNYELNYQRLLKWCNPLLNATNYNFIQEGSNSGVEFANKYQNDYQKLNLINDYAWLKEEFIKRYGSL